MRLAVPVLLLGLLTFTARADDPITRHWRVRVALAEHVETHSKSATLGTRDEVQTVNASYSYVVGTTDDDLAGNAYAIAQDAQKDLRGVTGTGSFRRVETMKAAAAGSVATVHTIDGNLDLKNSSSECLYTSDHWECTVRVSFAAQESWSPVGPPPNATIAGTFGTFGGGAGLHANETWSHATKLAHERFTYTTDHTVANGTNSNTQKITVDIEPLEAVGYEAVFVPDAGYDRWLPEGPPVAPSTHQPATLGLHIELRDARTHAAIAKAFRTHFILDSSRLVGDCMNWPSVRNARPPEQPDLYFEAAKNRSGTVSTDTQSLDLGNGSGGGAVVVSSRDWGGYAKLRAHVVVADGAELDVVVGGVGGSAGTTALTIPKDDDGNHIADAWDRTANGGHASDVDDENTPGGWGARGDGYTLFEEYRGFIEADPSGTVVPAKGPKKRHVRFDPNKRDVFVGLAIADRVVPLAMAGIASWAQTSSASVHFIADSNLLAKTAGDYSDAFPRRADAWGDGHPDLFGKPQTGLWVQSTLNLGTSPAHADPIRAEQPSHTSEVESGFFTSFGSVKGVTLDLAQASATVSGMICYANPDCRLPSTAHPEDPEDPLTAQLALFAATQAGLVPLYSKPELRRRAAYGNAHEAELDRRFTQFVFIHELGHAAGMYHHGLYADPLHSAHGDKACPMRYWHMGDNYVEVEDFIAGVWDLAKAHDGSAWRWCTENLPQMRFADP